MLILKEPIQLKSLSPIVSLSDGFLERMEANYMQIQAKYSPEELFHLISQPPEIFMEEGGMTTLVTQNQSQMNQEVRLEMIHNLFNRLVMADSANFTYQDTVFVQNMLEKLGVRNVSEFMKQLYEIQEDTKNIRQLSKIYEKNTDTLRTVIETVKEQEGKEGTNTTKEENNTFPSYWIHNEIFRRLRTENVYNTTAAFQKNVLRQQNLLVSREIEMAEQVRTSEALRLQTAESRVMLKESPLLEHRVNIYEEGAGEEGEKPDAVTGELKKALLLNISDEIYQIHTKQHQEKRDAWYQFEGNFRQTLENTLNRFQMFHFEHTFYDRKRSSTYQENINAFRRQEISQLNKILELAEKQDTILEATTDHTVEQMMLTLREQTAESRTDREETLQVLEQIQETLLRETRHSHQELLRQTERIREAQRLQLQTRETAGESRKENVLHRAEIREELKELLHQTEVLELSTEEREELRAEILRKYKNLTKEETERLLTEAVEKKQVETAVESLEETLGLRREEERDIEEYLSRMTERNEEQVHRVTGADELQILEEINETNRIFEERNLEEQQETTHSLTEEVRRLNEENRRKMEEMHLVEEKIRRVVPVQIDKERTRRETLMLLEHPEMISRYSEEHTDTTEQSEEIVEQEVKRIQIAEEIRRLEQMLTVLRQETTAEVQEQHFRERKDEEQIRRFRELEHEERAYSLRETETEEQKRHVQNLTEEERKHRFQNLTEEERKHRFQELTKEEHGHQLQELTEEEYERRTAEMEELVRSLRQTEQIHEELRKEFEHTLGLNHRETVSSETVSEQLHEELEAFLTSLESEKKIEEVQSISQVQEALAGRRNRRKEAGNPKSAAKRLVLLQSSLRELEHTIAAVQEHTEYTEQIQKLSEPRKAYVRTLEQIERIIRQYQVKETGVPGEREQIRKQQTVLLETVRNAEYSVQHETERFQETLQKLEQFQKNTKELESHMSEVKEIIRELPVRKGKQQRIRSYPPEVKKIVQTYLDTVTHKNVLHETERISHGELQEKQLLQHREQIQTEQTLQHREQVQSEQLLQHREQLQTEQLLRQEEHLQKEENIRREETEQVLRRGRKQVEQILKREQKRVFRKEHQTTAVNRTVQLTHKEPETFSPEMIMESVERPAVVKKQTELVNEEIQTQKIVTKQQVHTQVDNVVRNSSERINEMINRGVQRQINSISDQVYHKLEKKLSNDRKRRGY